MPSPPPGRAAHDWSSTPYTERARILQCAADLISYYCDRLVEHHAFQTDQASQTGEDHNTSVLRPYVKLFMREQSRTILP